MKMFRFVCLAIFTVVSLTFVPAVADNLAPLNRTDDDIDNEGDINTNNYSSVNFSVTGGNHTYSGALSGSGIVNYTGKNVNNPLNLAGNNSAFSGTFNVRRDGDNAALYFTSVNASIPYATLNLGDKTYVRTKLTEDATIQIGALEGTGFVRNDESSGHTITYQLGGANIDATFSGQIMNTWKSDVNNYPVAIKKVGSGAQTLAGDNTYTGATTISGGKLILSGSGNLTGTSGVTVASGATLEFANSSVTFNKVISGAGSLTKSTANTTVTLTGVNTYTGKTSITAGKLILSGSADLTGTSSIEITSSAENMYATLQFNQNEGVFNLSANVSSEWYTNAANGGKNTGRLVKLGSATLNITGNVSKTGFDTRNGITNFGTSTSPNANNLQLGFLSVDGGATVNYYGGDTGTMTIYAGGSSYIGNSGTGTLNIYGSMSSSSTLHVAETSSSSGEIHIYSGGSLSSSAAFTVGNEGSGTLTIENGGKFTYTSGSDFVVGYRNTSIINNYGTIDITNTGTTSTGTLKIGQQTGSNGTVNVYQGGSLTTKGTTLIGLIGTGSLNINGGEFEGTTIEFQGRGSNANGSISVTNGGSLTADKINLGQTQQTSYAVTATVTLNNGTLSVVNVAVPQNESGSNKVNNVVNLGKGTVITGAATDGASVWDEAVNINLTYADGTVFQVDEGKKALINSSMSGNGKLIKTGEGTLLINAAQGAVDIQRLVVSSGRLDMKEYLTGALEVGLPDADNSTVIFSPGNSVGSLEITGDFTLNKGATLLIEQEGSHLDTLSATTFFIESDSILDLPVDSLQPGLSTPIIQSTNAFGGDLATDAFWNGLLTSGDAYYWNLKVVNGNTVYASIDANAIPEPSTWALMALGAMGLLYWRKRK